MHEQQGASEKANATSRPALDTLPIGSVLGGRYRIIRRIGGGGMGEVYKVEHLDLGRRFALKLMRRDLSSKDLAAARFDREARAMSAVNNIHIVPIIDFGRTEEGIPFYVMELLQGEELRQMLARGALSQGLAAEIVRQAAVGAAAAHQSGIVHRDLKPANVFVGSGVHDAPLVRLLDFGIAKVGPALREGEERTVTGAMLGTPHYMSPEQARGVEVDRRSDVYSLGVVLYEALTGRKPFDGEGYNAVIYSIVTNTPERADRIRPDVPRGLADVVEKAMSRDLDRRFQSAEALAAALAPFARVVTATGPMSDLGPATRTELPSLAPVPHPAMPRNHLRLILAAILGVAGGAAAATLVRQHTSAPVAKEPGREAFVARDASPPRPAEAHDLVSTPAVPPDASRTSSRPAGPPLSPIVSVNPAVKRRPGGATRRRPQPEAPVARPRSDSSPVEGRGPGELFLRENPYAQ